METKSFFSLQKASQSGIRKRWDTFVSGEAQELMDVGPWGKYAIDTFSEYLFRGKSLRAVLVSLGMEVADVVPGDTADTLALVMEIVQTSLLFQDDVMDRDETRRGTDSLHIRLKKQGQEWLSPGRTGENVAVCVGDFGFYLGNLILSSLGRPDLTQLVSAEYAKVALAQIADVTIADTGKFPDEKAVRAVYLYKTGRYSIGLPLVAGLTLAKTNLSVIPEIWKLSEKAGELFQLRDDWLNLYGNPETTGKPVGSDLREGKKTLPLCWLYKKASARDKRAIATQIAKAVRTDEDVASLMKLMETYGMNREIATRISDLSQDSRYLINTLPAPMLGKKHLADFLDFLEHRER